MTRRTNWVGEPRRGQDQTQTR